MTVFLFSSVVEEAEGDIRTREIFGTVNIFALRKPEHENELEPGDGNGTR